MHYRFCIYAKQTWATSRWAVMHRFPRDLTKQHSVALCRCHVRDLGLLEISVRSEAPKRWGTNCFFFGSASRGLLRDLLFYCSTQLYIIFIQHNSVLKIGGWGKPYYMPPPPLSKIGGHAPPPPSVPTSLDVKAWIMFQGQLDGILICCL